METIKTKQPKTDSNKLKINNLKIKREGRVNTHSPSPTNRPLEKDVNTCKIGGFLEIEPYPPELLKLAAKGNKGLIAWNNAINSILGLNQASTQIEAFEIVWEVYNTFFGEPRYKNIESYRYAWHRYLHNKKHNNVMKAFLPLDLHLPKK